DPAATDSYPLSLHDALPIYRDGDEPGAERRPTIEAAALLPGRQKDLLDHVRRIVRARREPQRHFVDRRIVTPDQRLERREVALRSEEHTSELQSLRHLVCRL